MARKSRPITVELLQIETVNAEHPCPWIRATEILIKAAERLGLPMNAPATNTPGTTTNTDSLTATV